MSIFVEALKILFSRAERKFCLQNSKNPLEIVSGKFYYVNDTYYHKSNKILKYSSKTKIQMHSFFIKIKLQ